MINLKKEFGSQYRVFYDPSWHAETSAARTEIRQAGHEHWYYELRGASVTIYPRSNDTVGAHWLGRGSGALSRACLSSRRLDGEMLYVLRNSALREVLDNVGIYRKRQVTEASRARGRELAAKYGFGKK